MISGNFLLRKLRSMLPVREQSFVSGGFGWCQALQGKGKKCKNTIWIHWLGLVVQCIIVCSASQKLLVVGYCFKR